MNRRRTLLLAVALALSLSAAGLAGASERFARFEAIPLGANRALVMVLLGDPDARRVGNFMGVAHETLTYKDGARVFELTLVADHVIAKSTRTNH